MEQGNEGDEILFFSCRQFGCDLAGDLQRVGQLTADVLLYILGKALVLITDGEVKVPEVLPQNIALRHRICTDLSLKIKELGFLGECGYNQLLYPTEQQTRELLKWLVDKVPRSADEGVEELLGANALLLRNVHASLQRFQRELYALPCCLRGRPARPLRQSAAFAHAAPLQAAALLHGNLSARLQELRVAELRNRRYLGGKGGKGGGGDADAAQAAQTEQLRQSVAAALTQSVTEAAARGRATRTAAASAADVDADRRVDSGAGDDDDVAEDVASSDVATQGVAAVDMSFQDLLRAIAAEDAKTPAGDGAARETRFAHATVFAAETGTTTTTALPAMAVASSASGGARSAAGAAAATATPTARGASASSGAAATATPTAATTATQLDADDAQRQEQLRQLRAETTEMSLLVEAEAREEETLAAAVAALDAELGALTRETEALEKECVARRQALEMIPSAADNIAKLQAICDKGTERLKALEQEWRGVEAPLVDAVADKERTKQLRLHRVSKLLEEIAKYRELMLPMVHELKEQQQRAEALAGETKKLPKNLNRALYTHRIMDITASIAKQNKEIAKIVSDIRDKQKSINAAQQTLQRADAIAEELIYKAASERSDAAMVDTYRRLKNLRAAFEALVAAVADIGQAEKKARDLETKIDQEQARVAGYNFDRIKQDLDAVQAENHDLMAQIKAIAKK